MHADHHFVRGARHTVCEDYAVSGGAAGGAFAVLADGCSSSPHTDVGARLLVLASLTCHSSVEAARRAADVAEELGLPPSCTDATLIDLRQDSGSVRATVYGDGMLVAVGVDGTLRWWHVRYNNGAPDYPSYSVDPARREAWLEQAGSRTLTSGTGSSKTSEVVEVGPPPLSLRFDAEETRVVCALSDGVDSFVLDGPNGVQRVPPLEVVRHLVAFKQARGAFVQRRVRQFLKRTATAKGWSHHDDLCVAAIWMEA